MSTTTPTQNAAPATESDRPQTVTAPSAWRSISLVARREITTRARTRSFLVTIALLLVLIVGGLIAASVFIGPDKPEKIGVVGNPALSQPITAIAKAGGTKVTIVPIADAAAARAQVADGKVALALAPGGNGGSAFQLISKDEPDATLAAIVRSAVSQTALTQALGERGVDANAVATAAAQRSTVTEVRVKKQNKDEGQRLVIAFAGAGLLSMAIMIGGALVASGVVEEKTSRIVELLLATIKPLHLMWGKILGVGAIALLQVLVLGGAALITGAATGLLTLPSTAISVFAVGIVWFLLGFIFFATLYAATGALVSRQEELGSASAPLTVLSLGMLYSVIFGFDALDTTFLKTLSWIPPFSATLMPMRIATGNTYPLQVVGTLVIMVIACLVTAWVAARVYQRSVLRTGSRVKWTHALR
ncbi:ABC transporter permease [Williamsia sp. CHRR-6]|uniref:ABC transporter permease n=1 Tax=Williamsia sp. CHRR-6 TaxID=2835871 RepID=UPI001BDAC4D2|nr:ABC transporter permease [Williamsia sp. CHRR-6]MBT0566460.1 ABC transporter permease [Williamsia sp. CHRR-6]